MSGLKPFPLLADEAKRRRKVSGRTEAPRPPERLKTVGVGWSER
jgi:hypothetical protein